MLSLRRLLRGVGYKLVRISEVGIAPRVRDLKGDRDIEWSWVASQLPAGPGSILDFGCGASLLPLLAAMKSEEVVGLDLGPVQVPYQKDNLRYQQADILDLDFGDAKFDVIINCSSIEHVGLPGRYGSRDAPDGDLEAMDRLRSLMSSPNGIMLLTLPVGQDSVFPPLHRVYGERRLDQLLRGFSVLKKEFWSKKRGSNTWVRVSQAEALNSVPSRAFYSLGLYVLENGAAISLDD